MQTLNSSYHLQPLFTTVWGGEIVSDDWCKEVIIKIPKKGTLNYICTPLSVPSKIMAKIIIRRMTDAVDAVLRKEKQGSESIEAVLTRSVHSATSYKSAHSGRDSCK